MALDCNLTLMVGNDRLHNRQAQAGAMLLGGVVRREQPLAFLGRQALAGVGDANLDLVRREAWRRG